MSKIDSALFSFQKQALEKEQRCTDCGGAVVIKQSKHGLFKSCENYPSCQFSGSLHQHDGHIIKNLNISCPECQGELVLRQGRFGMFIGCSAYPLCEHIEKREPTEPLPQEGIACPECNKGLLTARQSRFGKRFYACNAYPKCKFALNTKPILGECIKCHYPLLTVKKIGEAKYCASKKCQHKQE